MIIQCRINGDERLRLFDAEQNNTVPFLLRIERRISGNLQRSLRFIQIQMHPDAEAEQYLSGGIARIRWRQELIAIPV